MANVNTQTQPEKTVEVLYQKMGNRWFAFSLIGDEVFVGSISQQEIDAAENPPPRQSIYSRSGNT